MSATCDIDHCREHLTCRDCLTDSRCQWWVFPSVTSAMDKFQSAFGPCSELEVVLSHIKTLLSASVIA